MRRPRLARLPARTVRWRFTALYGVAFLLSGAGLLGIAVLVALASSGGSETVAVGNPPAGQTALAEAHARIDLLQTQLAEVRKEQRRQLLAGAAVALTVMAGVSAVLGRFVAGRVLRPLRTITAATRRISADNLHERLAVAGPADEVKDLADTIDGLLERLEASFAAQRRFVANASHELRTPLATMRARLDVAVAKVRPAPQTVALADRLRTDLDQVDRLLEGLLTLARAQHDASPGKETVLLGRLVSAALDARAAGITDRDLSVRTDGLDGDVAVTGCRTLLSRLVDNVIDNAVVHNHDGGWIQASVTADGRMARLVVETGGPALDPAQVARLGRPFQRLGADRTGSGSGLGLSIVASVAAAHGGDLELSARPKGGLRVVVRLPLAPVRAKVPA